MCAKLHYWLRRVYALPGNERQAVGRSLHPPYCHLVETTAREIDRFGPHNADAVVTASIFLAGAAQDWSVPMTANFQNEHLLMVEYIGNNGLFSLTATQGSIYSASWDIICQPF